MHFIAGFIIRYQKILGMSRERDIGVLKRPFSDKFFFSVSCPFAEDIV